MKLITQTLLNRFNEVGDQSESENPLVIAKFFDPCGSGTWYATEYNPETNICFGYVTGLVEDEWGTFSIGRLENRSVKRDIHFKEIRFDALMKKLS